MDEILEQEPTKKEKVWRFIKKVAVPVAGAILAVGMFVLAKTVLDDYNAKRNAIYEDRKEELMGQLKELAERDDDPWSFVLKDKNFDESRQLIGTRDDVQQIVESLDPERFEIERGPWAL